MAIILPKTPLPATRLSPKTLLLYGMPKVGKTTILSQLENNLIVELDEGGADFIEALKLQANSISDLSAICNKVIESGKPYRYASLDTATKLEEWCEYDATDMYRHSPIGKNFTGNSVLNLANGAGYLWLRQSYTKWLTKFRGIAERIILVGHVKDKFLGDNEDAKMKNTVASNELDLTGQIKRMACAGADAIGFLYRSRDGKLMVNFKTTEQVICGGRCKHLINAEFEFDWKKIYID